MKRACPSTRRPDTNKCNWVGDVETCRQVHDNGINGGYYVYFICPECGSTVAEVNHNTPLNHELQQFI